MCRNTKGIGVAGKAGGKRLVIVESPTKATKIASFLGDGYIVESSRGHVRDLPTGAAEVPAKYKGEKWARTGVDVDHGFEPLYVVNPDKKATIRSLKEALAQSDELLLATDGDREGEAIAWHLLQELKPKVLTRRMVFHEITPQAIADAVANPRELDTDLVDAQETRRILDRLYGYEVSPVLWKKVMPRLSAGRVQSVATRLIVDRERERIAFRNASYWDLDAVLDAGAPAEPPLFPARLTHVGSDRIAQGRDFDSHGALVSRSKETLVHLDQTAAEALAASLPKADFAVSSIESKPYTRRPYAPFRTTTMQQEAGRKLGFTAQRAMSVAQDLYEAGFITYMRTDSVTLSDTAITAARNQVKQLFGADYVPDKPRVYTSKVKNAQEAHEAIRPAGEVFQTPAQTEPTGDQFRLYELIWMRTVASQMKDAEGQSITVKRTKQSVPSTSLSRDLILSLSKDEVRPPPLLLLVLAAGLRRLVVALLLVVAGRNDVGAGEPAVEVDVGAAARAKRVMNLRRRLAADRDRGGSASRLRHCRPWLDLNAREGRLVEPVEMHRIALAGEQRHGLVERQADHGGIGARRFTTKAPARPWMA